MIQRIAFGLLNISQPLLCNVLKNRSGIETSASADKTRNERIVTVSQHKNLFSNVREKNVSKDAPIKRQ
jgi:hypothetical protein